MKKKLFHDRKSYIGWLSVDPQAECRDQRDEVNTFLASRCCNGDPNYSGELVAPDGENPQVYSMLFHGFPKK